MKRSRTHCLGALSAARLLRSILSALGFWRRFTKHHGEQHLQRYLDESTFRYNDRIKLRVNDDERAIIATYCANGSG